MKLDLFDALQLLQDNFGDDCRMTVGIFRGEVQIQLLKGIYGSTIVFSTEELVHTDEIYAMMRFQTAIDRLNEVMEEREK